MEQEVNQEENVDAGPDNTVNTTDKVVDIQAKIDAAVKARVAREKETQKALQSQWEEERQALLAENELLKKQFQNKLDQELSNIPTSFRSLVSKLSVAEQITWLEEQEKEKSKQPKTPSIPNFDKKPNDKGGEVKHLPIDRIT